MVQKFLHALKVLRSRGLRFFFDYFRESVWFDLKHGTQTSARVPKTQQNLGAAERDAQDGLLYVASFTSVVRETTRFAYALLRQDQRNQAQFVDLGCGKGKTLLVHVLNQGSQPQSATVGIEYDPTLAEVARSNLTRVKIDETRCKIVTDSAVNVMSYISAPCSIIYLYNSFQGQTLRNVLGALKAHPHVLIYVDPAEADVLSDYGYSVRKKHKGRYNADTWLIATSSYFSDADRTPS